MNLEMTDTVLPSPNLESSDESLPLGSLPGAICTLPIPDTPAWREAAALGVDVAQLYLSLQMTVAQRIEAHAAALDLAITLGEAGRRFHEST
jgi:hypothetical protein